MQAKDIMRKRVVTVGRDMTLRELSKLLVDKQITGAPVVDQRGMLVGVVSQTDLVRHGRDVPTFEVPHYYRDPEAFLPPKGFQIVAPDYTKVGDIMTPVIFSAEESATLDELSRLMLRKRIHRVVITRAGKLCGIVSTLDLLRAYLSGAAKREPALAR